MGKKHASQYANFGSLRLDPMKSGISLTAPTPVLGVLPPKSFVLPAYATDFAGEYGRYEY